MPYAILSIVVFCITIVVSIINFKDTSVQDKNKTKVLYERLQDIDEYNVITCKNCYRGIKTTVKDIVGYKYVGNDDIEIYKDIVIIKKHGTIYDDNRLVNNTKDTNNESKSYIIDKNGEVMPSTATYNFKFSDCIITK